jgi:hypothetical protein
MAKKTSSAGLVSGTKKKVERKKVQRKKASGSTASISGTKKMKPATKKLQGSGTKTKSVATKASVKRHSKPVSGTKKKLLMTKDGKSPLRHQHK